MQSSLGYRTRTLPRPVPMRLPERPEARPPALGPSPSSPGTQALWAAPERGGTLPAHPGISPRTPAGRRRGLDPQGPAPHGAPPALLEDGFCSQRLTCSVRSRSIRGRKYSSVCLGGDSTDQRTSASESTRGAASERGPAPTRALPAAGSAEDWGARGPRRPFKIKDEDGGVDKAALCFTRWPRGAQRAPAVSASRGSRHGHDPRGGSDAGGPPIGVRSGRSRPAGPTRSYSLNDKVALRTEKMDRVSHAASGQASRAPRWTARRLPSPTANGPFQAASRRRLGAAPPVPFSEVTGACRGDIGGVGLRKSQSWEAGGWLMPPLPS